MGPALFFAGLALLVAAGLAARPALAQDAPDAALKEIQIAPDAFVRGTPVPAWAELLPPPAPRAELPRKPVVVWLADSHLRVAPTPAYVVNRIEQATEATALGQIGQPQIAFNPQYQRVQLHRVALLRGGEVIEHTNSAPVRFLQRETGLEQGVYSGVITASLLLPDVRAGDALHLVYTIEGENPIFGERYVASSSWDQPHPTLHRRVTLLAPADRHVRWRLVGGAYGDLRPDEQVSGSTRRLRFDARDLPGVELEPYMPADAVPLRWLQFSEYGSWAEVAQWARGLFPADAALPSEIAAEVERLRALPGGPAAQASQALQWVQSQIRYYSVALGESSHRPALPATVWERRYGDCKDKSLLLVQMLRALGLQAEPVLASLQTRRGPLALLPSPHAFDHAVVRVRIDGQSYLIDPTRLGQAGAIERMGQHLEQAAVLAVGGDSLETVVSPRRADLFASEVVERFALGAFDAPATLEVEQVWVGLQAEALRLALPALDDEQRRRWALSGYERRYPGLTVAAPPEVRDDPQANRIVTRLQFQVPQLVRDSGAAWVGRFFPANFQGSFAVPDQVSGRRHPVVVPAWPATLDYRLEMRWPDSVSAITDPSTQRVDTALVDLEVSRSFRGNTMRLNARLQPRVAQVAAAEVPKLIDDLRRVDQAIGGAMVVAKDDVKAAAAGTAGRVTMQQKMRDRLRTTIERSGKVIDSGKLSGEDLAGALCTRAESQADLGDPAAGMKDAEEAVRVAPGFARALQCRGNLLWASGQFPRAAADYTAALAVADDPFEAIYRRGHARFYEGRFELAAADFAKAATQQKDESDRLYMHLWQAFALRRMGQPLPASLQAIATRAPRGDWPRPALAMMADVLTPEEVLGIIDERQQGDERELALAEAWFYVGQLHAAHGEVERARAAFEAVRSRGITMYVEHVAAGFELERLKR